jgi:hypothetical protein
VTTGNFAKNAWKLATLEGKKKKMKKRKVVTFKLMPDDIWEIIHLFGNIVELMERRLISRRHKVFIEELLPTRIEGIIGNIPEMCVGARRKLKQPFHFQACRHLHKNTICFKKRFIPMFCGTKDDSIWFNGTKLSDSLVFCKNVNSIQRPTRIQSKDRKTTRSIDGFVYTHHAQKKRRYRQNTNPEWLCSKKLVAFEEKKGKEFFMKNVVPLLFFEYLRYVELLRLDLVRHQDQFVVTKDDELKYRKNQKRLINYTKWLSSIEGGGLSTKFCRKIKQQHFI